MGIQRNDDFEKRSEKLRNLSDSELDRYFWELAEKIVDPLIAIARTNTSPSIERSVLLRMGFNSLQAKHIVDKTAELGLLGKGAGNVVYKVAREMNADIYEAGKGLAEGKNWELVERLFKGVNAR